MSSRWTRPKVIDVSYRPGRKHQRQGEEADGLLGETCPPPSCPCFHSALPMFPSVGCAQHLLRTLPALFLLSAFSLNSTAARPPLILVELVTVTYTSSPLSAPPDAPPRSLCRVLPDGGLLCTVQSSAYESLASMHRAMPLVHVGRAAASVALDASV